MIDSKGAYSRTLAMVTIAFCLCCVVLVYSWVWTDKPISLTEFGSSITLILSPWVAREWVKKDGQ